MSKAGDGIAFSQPTGASSRDEQCLKFLSDSLETCVRDHCSCITKNWNTENWIPSRLMDVGLSSPENWNPSQLMDVNTHSSELDSVNLVERDKVRERHGNEPVPYLTLSHVWGDESFFTLTESNFQDVKAGISLQSLRPCFQDAINITRRLGKRYLWIDSLW
jgi:Heterokaryon incompatibility protein (HET)